MAKYVYEVELLPQPDGCNPMRYVKADGIAVDGGDGFIHFHTDSERTSSFARDHVVRIERQAPKAE